MDPFPKDPVSFTFNPSYRWDMRLSKCVYYRGRKEPFITLGHNQCRLFKFAYENRGWHSYKKNCRATKRAIKALTDKGYIEVNEFHQFRFKG